VDPAEKEAFTGFMRDQGFDLEPIGELIERGKEKLVRVS
jgi:uncharacterized alpha-E superfamily protein